MGTVTAAAAQNRPALGSGGSLDIEQVARHEAAHATIFLAGGATFDTIHVSWAANGRWSGQITNVTGVYSVQLVGLVAGAVADAVPAGEFIAATERLLAGDYCGAVETVIKHLITSACCSADFAAAQEMAAEIDWGRSIAYDVAGTALLNLYGHHERWNALTEAVLKAQDRRADLPFSWWHGRENGYVCLDKRCTASARCVWSWRAGPSGLAWFGTAGGRARIAVDGPAGRLSVFERGHRAGADEPGEVTGER